MPTLGVTLGSAHQMGTCRMAASPQLGAAKPSGETWEVPGLFVADTSAFPTASGVNPMWTCAAIAHHVSQQVKQHLEAASPELGEPASRRRQRLAAWGCGASSARAAGKPEPLGQGPAPLGGDAAAAKAAEDVSTTEGEHSDRSSLSSAGDASS